jgi:DNA-binding CsgD family transcriptional regulator
MTWDKQEELYLLENWKVKSLHEIIDHLNKTENSVIRKARRLVLDVSKDTDELIKKKWTKEDDKFLIENYHILPLTIILEKLNRNKNSILKRSQFLGISRELRRWTPYEINYLKENWGIRNVNYIAKKIDRTPDAVLLKAHQLSLKEQVLANGYFLTPKCISDILNINIRKIYVYMLHNKLIHRKLKVGKKYKYQITIDAFLDFLKNNLQEWNSKNSNIQLIKSYYSSHYITKNNNFSVSIQIPDWLEQKIENDKNNIYLERLNLKWTKYEDILLMSLTKKGCTFNEISKHIKRSHSSVKTRFYTIRKDYI